MWKRVAMVSYLTALLHFTQLHKYRICEFCRHNREQTLTAIKFEVYSSYIIINIR